MATAGRIGTGRITTIMTTVLASTGVSGGLMRMCSDITVTAGSIMILAGAGSPAAAPPVVFMGVFTEEADLVMAAAATAAAAAGMADDARISEIL